MVAGALHLGLLGLTACSFTVSYDGSHFACDPPDGDCPPGYTCGDDGFCTRPGPADPDADLPPSADADVDADTASPLMLRFGERPGSDVQGVTSDTCLDSDFPDANYGGDPDVYVRDSSGQVITGLIRFDVGALPAGAQVQSATLELWTSTNALANGSARLYAIDEDWDEGNGSETPGDASWYERQPGVAWSGDGALPPSSEANAVAELTPSAPATSYTVDLPASLVQAWLDDPSSNYGLLGRLEGSSDDVVLESSESTQSARRPQLTVTYLP